MSPGYFMICLDVIVFIIFVVLFSFLYLTFMIYTLIYFNCLDICILLIFVIFLSVWIY